MRRPGSITAIGIAALLAAWVAVVFLGRETQPAALVGMRLLTTVIASATLLWLARAAPAVPPGKSWVLHLAAVVQFLLAGVGVMFLPALALLIWGRYPSFPSYDFGVVWLLPTIAAFLFCVTRPLRPQA
ncbi:MAG TPA: hypothetical protein VH814_13355 [Steroidobacteraceae bacterium]|jgi:hypothetical protein